MIHFKRSQQVKDYVVVKLAKTATCSGVRRLSEAAVTRTPNRQHRWGCPCTAGQQRPFLGRCSTQTTHHVMQTALHTSAMHSSQGQRCNSCCCCTAFRTQAQQRYAQATQASGKCNTPCSACTTTIYDKQQSILCCAAGCSDDQPNEQCSRRDYGGQAPVLH